MSAICSEVGNWIVVAHEYFVLLSHDSIQVRSQDCSEACSHHNNVILFEVGWSRFSLLAKAEVIGVSREESLPCKIADREHKIN